MIKTDYLKQLTARLLFPEEAVTALLADADAVNTSAAVTLFDDTVRTNEESDFAFADMDAHYAQIAAAAGISEHAAAMLYLLSACETLEKRYAARGLSDALFVDTMSDLRYKLIECKTNKDVWGTFVPGWFGRYYRMDRFALGRFQFEKNIFDGQVFGVAGHYVRNGDPILNMHIPSSGVPLTDEIRYDSYRRARDFYFPGTDKPVAFCCSSWLLFPDYEDYIPAHLNLKRFRRDFTVTGVGYRDSFGDAWRVFGPKADLPPEELPTDTTQRRIFAQFCRDGKQHGSGYGIFLFDGEKILTNPGF